MVDFRRLLFGCRSAMEKSPSFVRSGGCRSCGKSEPTLPERRERPRDADTRRPSDAPRDPTSCCHHVSRDASKDQIHRAALPRSADQVELLDATCVLGSARVPSSVTTRPSTETRLFLDQLFRRRDGKRRLLAPGSSVNGGPAPRRNNRRRDVQAVLLRKKWRDLKGEAVPR